MQAKAKAESHGYNSEDVYLHTAPLYHVGGLVSWLAMLRVGATQVLMPDYSPGRLLELVSEHSVTALIAVPAAIVDVLGSAQVNYELFRYSILGWQEYKAYSPSLNSLSFM